MQRFAVYSRQIVASERWRSANVCTADACISFDFQVGKSFFDASGHTELEAFVTAVFVDLLERQRKDADDLDELIDAERLAASDSAMAAAISQ